jgi:VWFA-related protein
MALGHAQQPEPTFRVASELVVIDLVAVDRQGRFISDLRAEEIEVKEDGKRQAVELLRLVGSPSASAPGTAAQSAPAPPVTLTPPTPEGRAPAGAMPRRLAIVVDTLSLSVDAVPRVRQSLLAAIADLPEGLPVLLATIGPDLQITQPLTADRAVLRQAVSALPTQLDPPAGLSRVFDAVDRLCAAAVDQRRVVDAAIEAGEQMVTDAQARSAVSSEALAMLADRLGGFEGRKHLVLYSAGHAISPVTQAVDAVGAAVSACTGLDAMAVRRDVASALGRLTNRAASEGLRTAIDRANLAQVTFYTLDPAGVTTSTIMPSTRGTAQTGGRGPMIAFPGLRADAGRDYIEGLAVQTGGLTVKSNDMAAVFRRAWEDATQYYLIGYAPPASKSKREVRKISVSVKRPGASVRFRRGYIATSSTPPIAPVSEAERAIEAALASPARFASDDIKVTAKVQRQTLAVEVLVPLTAITFSKVDGRHAADFAVHAVLQALALPTSVMDIPGKDISLRLTPEEYGRMSSANNLRVVLTAPAPTGDARVTVVVRDSGGWLGTSAVPCCAPGG